MTVDLMRVDLVRVDLVRVDFERVDLERWPCTEFDKVPNAQQLFTCINYNNSIQAISHYQKALQLNPDNGETHYELGTFLLSMVSDWCTIWSGATISLYH